MSFEDFLIYNDYPSWGEYLNDGLEESKTWDELFHDYNAIYRDEYYDYCEEQDIEAQF
jgi:hypothetical protein